MRTQPQIFKPIVISILMLCLSAFSFAASPQDRTDESTGGSAETGIDSGGIISESETLCGPNTANVIENVSAPSGDIMGFLIIRWEYRLEGGVWTDIPGENSLYFSPGYVSERMEFRRGCREESDQPWIYSNTIIKDVVPAISDVKVVTLDVTCKGGNDGYGGAQVIGGTPGYTFDWSSGNTGGSVYDFNAGNYTLTVTDQNGCTFTTSEFEINEPETIVTPFEIENSATLCPGSSDGSLIVDAYLGTPPYSFTWSNGVTTPYNFDLPMGTYHVSVTDARGCTNTLSGLNVEEPSNLNITGNEVATSCFGSNDGQAYIEVVGGTPPYFQIWNDGSLSSERNDLSSGIYEIAILDANGCAHSETIEISQPNPLAISPYVVNNIICKASLNVVPDGGTAPYTYEWNSGETSSYLTNLCPGEYIITTKDAHQCEQTDTLRISADYTIQTINIEMILNPYSESDEIVIKVPYKTEVFIEIYTTLGQLVESFVNLKPTDEKVIHLQLDLSKYSKGMYLVHVAQNGLVATDKIILAN